jgi:hypothetical protein
MPSNNLYLAVLPLVQFNPATIGHVSFGTVLQSLTLFPDRDFATWFFPDEVDQYITVFHNTANNFLTGGHVAGYEFFKELTHDGRVIVRVVQHVS